VASTERAAGGDGGLARAEPDASRVTRVAGQILGLAISGAGPFKSAAAVAAEVQAKTDGVEEAVEQFVALHLRLAAASGAVTGLGGLATLAVALPANVLGYFTLAGRLCAGVAHLRGYDLGSPEVRTALLLSMAGADGATEILREAGVKVDKRGVASALRRLPDETLAEINSRIGARLSLTGQFTGVVSLTTRVLKAARIVPLVGAPVGATTDWLAMRSVAAAALAAFPPPSAAVGVVIEGEVVTRPTETPGPNTL
jgi:hypothetical protein